MTDCSRLETGMVAIMDNDGMSVYSKAMERWNDHDWFPAGGNKANDAFVQWCVFDPVTRRHSADAEIEVLRCDGERFCKAGRNMTKL